MYIESSAFKSVKSDNLCKSVIQTEEKQETEFKIILPNK
jgi:hypothetical protein